MEFLGNKLLPKGKHVFVGTANGRFGDGRHERNVLQGLFVLWKERCDNVNTGRGHGDGTFAGGAAKLIAFLGQMDSRLLHVDGKGEIGTEAGHEIFRGHRAHLLLQKRREQFEAATNVFFGHSGQGTDFLEATSDLFLTTGDIDAGGHDLFIAFAL